MLLPEDSTHYWWAQPADGTMRITPIAVGVNILEPGDVTFTVFDLSDTVVGTRTISYSGPGGGSELAAADIVITGTTASDLYRGRGNPHAAIFRPGCTPLPYGTQESLAPWCKQSASDERGTVADYVER